MNLQENISRIKEVMGLLTEEIDFDNITFFKTSQGSKYIRLPDGRLKRWKSYHQNTSGEDMGLHSWSDFSFFVDPKFYDSVSAFEQLSTNKEYKVALTKDKAGKLAYLIFDNGNWRPAKWEDAYPKYVENNPDLKGNVLTWEYSKEPQIGFHTVDGNFKNKSSQLSSFHIGNPVSEISNFTDEDKKLFFPSHLQESISKIKEMMGLIKESIKNNKIICDKCGWSWDIEDGGDDLYICHKCGNDNTPKK